MAEQLTAAEAAQAKAAEAAALQACLDYMHVDRDDANVDRIEREFMPAAKAYLSGAGIREPAEPGPDRELYNLAFHALVLHYYEHRDADREEFAFPANVRPIINQLKHSSEGCI